MGGIKKMLESKDVAEVRMVSSYLFDKIAPINFTTNTGQTVIPVRRGKRIAVILPKDKLERAVA